VCVRGNLFMDWYKLSPTGIIVAWKKNENKIHNRRVYGIFLKTGAKSIKDLNRYA